MMFTAGPFRRCQQHCRGRAKCSAEGKIGPFGEIRRVNCGLMANFTIRWRNYIAVYGIAGIRFADRPEIGQIRTQQPAAPQRLLIAIGIAIDRRRAPALVAQEHLAGEIDARLLDRLCDLESVAKVIDRHVDGGLVCHRGNPPLCC